MIPHSLSGTVTRYLLDGPHAETLAVLEIDRSEIVSASNGETDINPSDIGREDYDLAMDALIQSFIRHKQ
jgi:hypothetical protein